MPKGLNADEFVRTNGAYKLCRSSHRKGTAAAHTRLLPTFHAYLNIDSTLHESSGLLEQLHRVEKVRQSAGGLESALSLS
jgi:hypothetical protein